MFSAPAFYNVTEFADMFQVSEGHVRHAARNWLFPGKSANRAKLPEGYGAFVWADIYVIFLLQDRTAVERMFNVKVRA
jgi:hypothetical protein